MLNATRFLTTAEQQQVEAAVREAEAQTSAEIVVVVATESGRYDRAESIVGLIGAVLGVGASAHAYLVAAGAGNLVGC